ncbi:unnamed protein product, partial [Symbiodinium sp. KB8]
MVAGGTPVSAVEEQMRTGACMSEAQIEAFRWYLEHPEEKGLGIVERMREQSKSKGPAKAAAAADGSRVDVQKLVRMVKGGQLPKRQAMMVLRRKGATHEDFTEFTMAMVGADDATAVRSDARSAKQTAEGGALATSGAEHVASASGTAAAPIATPGDAVHWAGAVARELLAGELPPDRRPAVAADWSAEARRSFVEWWSSAKALANAAAAAATTTPAEPAGESDDPGFAVQQLCQLLHRCAAVARRCADAVAVDPSSAAPGAAARLGPITAVSAAEGVAQALAEDLASLPRGGWTLWPLPLAACAASGAVAAGGAAIAPHRSQLALLLFRGPVAETNKAPPVGPSASTATATAGKPPARPSHSPPPTDLSADETITLWAVTGGGAGSAFFPGLAAPNGQMLRSTPWCLGGHAASAVGSPALLAAIARLACGAPTPAPAAPVLHLDGQSFGTDASPAGGSALVLPEASSAALPSVASSEGSVPVLLWRGLAAGWLRRPGCLGAAEWLALDGRVMRHLTQQAVQSWVAAAGHALARGVSPRLVAGHAHIKLAAQAHAPGDEAVTAALAEPEAAADAPSPAAPRSSTTALPADALGFDGVSHALQRWVGRGLPASVRRRMAPTAGAGAADPAAGAAAGWSRALEHAARARGGDGAASRSAAVAALQAAAEAAELQFEASGSGALAAVSANAFSAEAAAGVCAAAANAAVVMAELVVGASVGKSVATIKSADSSVAVAASGPGSASAPAGSDVDAAGAGSAAAAWPPRCLMGASSSEAAAVAEACWRLSAAVAGAAACLPLDRSLAGVAAMVTGSCLAVTDTALRLAEAAAMASAAPASATEASAEDDATSSPSATKAAASDPIASLASMLSDAETPPVAWASLAALPAGEALSALPAPGAGIVRLRAALLDWQAAKWIKRPAAANGAGGEATDAPATDAPATDAPATDALAAAAAPVGADDEGGAAATPQTEPIRLFDFSRLCSSASSANDPTLRLCSALRKTLDTPGAAAGDVGSD